MPVKSKAKRPTARRRGVSPERLADWWLCAQLWLPPYEGPNWSRERIMGAFLILDELVPEATKSRLWREYTKTRVPPEPSPAAERGARQP